jgi:RimJ/RimL family protein N-acetyltransferase
MDDVAAYTSVLQAPEVRTSLHLPDDIGGEQAFERIASALGHWQLRNCGQWALEERATGTFVGRAGAFWPNRDDWPGIEIGWALHPQHWGKGYATEAGAAARDWVFANHDVDELYSCILHENTHSQAVAKRLGFTPWEERTFKSFPKLPHMIWRLQRAELQATET